MISEIRSAIYNHTLTCASLNSNNTWWMKAPQGDESNPYCVISFVSNPISRDTQIEFEELSFQINIYGTSLLTIEGIEAEVRTAYRNAEASIDTLLTNYKVAGIIPLNAVILEVDDEYWQVAIRYKIMIKEV